MVKLDTCAIPNNTEMIASLFMLVVACCDLFSGLIVCWLVMLSSLWISICLVLKCVRPIRFRAGFDFVIEFFEKEDLESKVYENESE